MALAFESRLRSKPTIMLKVVLAGLLGWAAAQKPTVALLRHIDSTVRRRANRAFRHLSLVPGPIIGPAVVLWNIVHRPPWILQTIMFMVGAQVLPLAFTLRYQAYDVSGISLSVGALVFPGFSSVPARDAVGAIGSRIILVASASTPAWSGPASAAGAERSRSAA